MINQQDLKEDLQTIPWLFDLTAEQIEKLSTVTSLKLLKQDEVLFTEGEREDSLFILLEGRVQLEMYVPTQGIIKLSVVEALDVLGWSSMTPVVRQRVASGRALMPCRLLCVDAMGLEHVCNADPAMGYIVMRRLANAVASCLLTMRVQLFNILMHAAQEEE
jgi:CRP/FNR family cyclic AMP-dependent transcriptional regulator